MDLIFYLPTPIFLISGIPQTMALLRRKTSEDISILTYALTWFAIMLILVKATKEGQTEIMLANGVSLTTVSTNLVLIIKYRIKQKA